VTSSLRFMRSLLTLARIRPIPSAGVLILLGLGISAPAPSSAAANVSTTACEPTISAMPLPAGDTNGDILAVTGDGHLAAGYVADDQQHQDVAVWRRHAGMWTVQDLGNLGITEPHSGLSATGVNARGEISIGVLTDVVGGWVYVHGAVHRLKDFAGGTDAYARSINGLGMVVGEALDAQGNDFAAVWRRWSSAPVKLMPVSGYDGSFAQGVDDRGDVVGGSFTNDGSAQVATRWGPAGHPVTLSGLGGDADAWSINDSGRVVGEASDATARYGVVWDRPGAPRSLGLFAGDEFSRVLDVAPNGYAVGFEGTNPPPPAVPGRQILFWPGHGPVRSLLPLSRDWSDGAYSHTLDDDGDVFGASARNHRSFPQPTVWTCALQQSFVPPVGSA
jgi:hypothetical protein